jgi:hypothetical protein
MDQNWSQLLTLNITLPYPYSAHFPAEGWHDLRLSGVGVGWGGVLEL